MYGYYRLVSLPVEDSRCLATIRHDASQKGKTPFTIVLTFTMGDFTYAENAIEMGLRDTRSFYVTRHNAGRQRAVRSPSLEESILNVVAVRPESSTRAVAHYVSVSHQTVCRVLNEDSLHLLHVQRV
ncbi:hypothetical protein TNCV_4149631 [Trichonephila clavipes]|uniref:Uncharacterized protein n=1 Tax=Trichonephila clavipes TaxID=2585209 RepID=A0A8X7BFI6_TRICX|nr:hypothetical protein TNCV_4149631 [Trichonephila clavipes]